MSYGSSGPHASWFVASFLAKSKEVRASSSGIQIHTHRVNRAQNSYRLEHVRVMLNHKAPGLGAISIELRPCGFCYDVDERARFRSSFSRCYIPCPMVTITAILLVPPTVPAEL